MNRAQPLDAQAGLLPLPRPLMTGEVLDAAFRLFRAGLLRCLPYSGLAVLVLELPTLYATFLAPPSGFNGLIRAASPVAGTSGRLWVYLLSLLLGVALFGLLTLRLHAISRGQRPRFRREIKTVLQRGLPAVIATMGALGFPLALLALSSAFSNLLPTEAMLVVAVPILWPTALFVVALPAFWCDELGPFRAIARSLQISANRSWRMFGALLATACMVMVFYALAAVSFTILTQMLGRADLFLLATVSSMAWFVVGVFGVPFALAVLIVANEDLKLRAALRRGAA